MQLAIANFREFLGKSSPAGSLTTNMGEPSQIFAVSDRLSLATGDPNQQHIFASWSRSGIDRPKIRFWFLLGIGIGIGFHRVRDTVAETCIAIEQLEHCLVFDRLFDRIPIEDDV